MTFDLINSSEIIFSIIDRYNIKSQDFASRTPNWIFSCLDEIAARSARQTSIRTIVFSNNRFMLPKFCKGVDALFINGRKADYNEDLYLNDSELSLNRGVGLFDANDSDKNDLKTTDNSGSDTVLDGKYIFGDENEGYPTDSDTRFLYRISTGWVHTNVEHGTAELKYKHAPYILDEDFGLEFPLIPNEHHTKEAIMFFILKTLLMRGYVHPLLNLRDNNPFINPALAYKDEVKQARIHLGRPSRDSREKWIRPLATLFGKRRQYYLGSSLTQQLETFSSQDVYEYVWVEDGTYCEQVNGVNTGYLITMEKEQVIVNSGPALDTNTPRREKSRVLNTDICPIPVNTLHMYMCVSSGDYDFNSEVEILPFGYTPMQIETPTLGGYGYFYLCLPDYHTFTLLDSLNQDLAPTMINLGGDGRNNTIYRLPDVFATDFSTLFTLTLNNL